MKDFKILLFIILSSLLALSSLNAQIIETPKFKASFEPKNPKVGEEVTVIFTAPIKDGWYVYSSDFEEGGPQVSKITFQPNASYQLVGKLTPIGAKEKYDDIFEMNVRYFTKKAEFRQKVKILKPNVKIEAAFAGQTCSDKTGQCIPFEEEFDIAFKAEASAKAEKPKEKTDENQETLEDKPEEEKIDDEEAETASDSTENITEQTDEKPEQEDAATTANEDELLAESQEEESLLGFLALAFLAGLVALLTPCVFPMIPMTVTFFSKDGRKKAQEGLSEEEIKALERQYRIKAIKKATFYGLSIIGIYTLLGTAVAWINGPAFANWLSTHWVPNMFFFLIFVVFALSFLGMFEIVLPHSWVSKADQEADKGGYYGIFFMAFTLSLVSFSCTGPIVGSILVQSAGGAIVKPILGMFAFSLAIAIPFSLFAAFPSWLNSLPKSGGWLNSVKVVLGFLELALALKFLSIADQVYHWGLLDRDVFLALWIVIFAMIGFYLLGKIRMPHDSPMEKVSVPRAVLAILSFAFVVYLVPGMYGAPLKPLSGYLPPQTTLDFDLYARTQVATGNAVQNVSNAPKAKYSDFLKLPHNLQGFFDYDEALAYAKKVNKPLFIDFTGHGCVNCREMESRVWSDQAVLQRLKEDYVLVALYVDDKKTLPEDEWYKSSYDDKVKKTIGAQNADFQITRFNNNAQPYYCLLNPNTEKLLQKPKAYDLDPQHFVEFLDKGKAAYSKQVIAKR